MPTFAVAVMSLAVITGLVFTAVAAKLMLVSADWSSSSPANETATTPFSVTSMVKRPSASVTPVCAAPPLME